jgi:hypothetical protein
MKIDYPTDVLNRLSEIVFDNSGTFIEKFCKGDVMDLYSVSFSESSVKFYFVLDSGQHISDSITIDEFIGFTDML